MFQNGVGHARGIVMRFDLVMAQTCYPALFVGLLPRGFGEDTPLFETLVGHIGLVAVAVAAALHTRDVDVVQIIQTGLQIEFVPVESGFQTACIGIAFRVVGIFICIPAGLRWYAGCMCPLRGRFRFYRSAVPTR